MLSKKLESFSERNSTLAPLIEQLDSYLTWLVEHNVTEVIPRVAAAKLGISEADALALLGLFLEAGLVKPRYDLVCTVTKSVLGSYYSRDEIPDDAECRLCDRQHDADELRVELVFEIVKGRAANAAA